MKNYSITYQDTQHNTRATVEFYANSLMRALNEYRACGLQNEPITAIFAAGERLEPAHKVCANIHSTHSTGTAQVVEQHNVNEVVCLYDGRLCTAIFNGFVGAYYVDDLFGNLAAYQPA